MTASKKWSLKRIFKPRPKSILLAHNDDTSSPIEGDEFPFHETPVKERPSAAYTKLALLPRSKNTVATASTALSTVNTSSMSLAPSPSNNHRGDEFSYSCANSTAWTGTPVHGADQRCGPAVAEERTGGEEVGKENSKEEADGFVELITERQRSRCYTVAEPAPTRTDNISASTSKALDSANTNEEQPQGYFSQGYNLMGFPHSNPFLSNSTGASQDREGSQLTTSASQARTASTVSKTIGTSTNPLAIESENSESPDEPPYTQRKSVNPEFFMEDPVVPPSPGNKYYRQRRQQDQQQETLLMEQQTPYHDDYDDPNHLYAEINVKHRTPHPITRQGSEGTASLAMTSISSITGHGSLFAKDYDMGGLSPLPGGLWRIGGTDIHTVANEEDYFDYSYDETLMENRSEKTGAWERISNVIVEVFFSTCQCFEMINPPISRSVGKEDSSEVDSKTSQGEGKGDKSEPMFSSPMED